MTGHIWRYLSTGWARVADDQDIILFWNPTRREFVPFTTELEADYRRLFKDLRDLGVHAGRRLSGGRQPYTGRRPHLGIKATRSAYTGTSRHRRDPPPPATGSDDD